MRGAPQWSGERVEQQRYVPKDRRGDSNTKKKIGGEKKGLAGKKGGGK